MSANPLRGVVLITSAMLFFTTMAALIKATTPNVPPGQAVFFRSFFSIPVILVWLWMRGQLRVGLKTRNPMNHAVRGVSGSLAMGLGFSGLALLPLPEVTAIRFATPIAMVVLAVLLLGETIRLIRLSAVVVGMLGVLIILWPRLGGGLGDAAALGALLSLGSALLAAFAQVSIKKMAGTEETAAIVFYFALTASTLSLVTVPFGWVVPTAEQAMYLVGAGLVGGCGQILLTSSYRFADAGALAPFTYTTMVWALLIGWLWFDELPTFAMLSGAALVIAAGGIIVWRERALGKSTVSEGKVRAHSKQ